MATLRVALVGVGGIGPVHFVNWKQVDRAQVCCACDVRPERREFLSDPALPFYTDLREMLEKEHPDIVDICTPSYLHFEHAMLAIEYGAHVLVEKPVCLELPQIDELFAAAARRGVQVMVAHVVRFWYEYLCLKRMVDERTYGRVLSAWFSRLGETPRWSFDNWMLDEQRSGLVPFDLHIHDLDFLVYTFGAPLSADSRRARVKGQDYLSVTYRYPDFFVDCEAGWFDTKYPFCSRFRVQFEKALVEGANGQVHIFTPDGRRETLSEAARGETGLNLPASNAYANELWYFAECVEKNLPPDRVPPDDLREVLRLLKEL